MSTAPCTTQIRLGPEHNGIRMTPDEFDAIDEYDDNFAYELIEGVVVVNPFPSQFERDPNEELGHWLRNYQELHPGILNKTIFEEYIRTSMGRRRADRVIWTGLGRRPNPRTDIPTIAIEFVSSGRRNWLRDYIDKRDEYLALGIREYWVINRFQQTLTIFRSGKTETEEQVLGLDDIYRPVLLPGFELPLRKLLQVCEDWDE